MKYWRLFQFVTQHWISSLEMKYFHLLLPLPSSMCNCQKLPKASLVGRGLHLINRCSSWLQLSSHPLLQPPRLNIALLVEGLYRMESAKFWRWASLFKDSCVKTSRILMRRDNQRWKEAIEHRQALRSVKPCYLKGKKKIDVLPPERACCSAQRSHSADVSEGAKAGWLTFTSPVNGALFELFIKCIADF